MRLRKCSTIKFMKSQLLTWISSQITICNSSPPLILLRQLLRTQMYSSGIKNNLGRQLWIPNVKKVHKKIKGSSTSWSVCRKIVAQGGQHLDKVHRNLIPQHQSVNCPLRMTKPRRHNNDFPRHNTLKVRIKKQDEEFAHQIRNSSKEMI